MADTHDVEHRPQPTLSQLWQLPVLAISLILFGLGLFMVQPNDTSQQFAELIDQVQVLVQARQYDQAIKVLGANAEVIGQSPKSIQGQYHQLLGDAIFLAQRSKGLTVPDNYTRVVQAYHAAQSYGIELDPTRVQRQAESMAMLGQIGPAFELLAGLGDSASSIRQRLLKQMIDMQMAQRPVDHPTVQRLLDQLADESQITPENEVWIIARRAELMMMQDESPLRMLLRSVARLQDETDVPLGRLMVQVGRAYLAEGDMPNAERWLMRARQELDEADPANGEALAALGRIRFDEGNAVEASELYEQVITHYPNTSAYRAAMVGRAECQARLGAIEKALADYTLAVDLAERLGTSNVAFVRRVFDSLQTQAELRFGQQQYALALRFLAQERRLYDEPTANLLQRQAVTHERYAYELLGLEGADVLTPEVWAAVGMERRNKAVLHLERSAEHYLALAHEVTVEDDELFGRSLWKAGDYFDKAGLHGRAIEAFTEFLASRSDDDPRALEARYRLAQAYQAQGNFARAISNYEQIIEQHPKSQQAYSSLVPLARCHLAKGPDGIADAERVLLTVVTDHPALRPESREYREALIELGQLYYRRGGEGDYEKAIQRLDEVVSRYGDAQSLPELNFQLGDAYRKSVQQIEQKLAGSLPPSRRAMLQAERVRRLDRASQSFAQVVEAYEQRDAQGLSDLQQLYLRNSYFYRADCAYDLERYEGPDGAIALYEKALQRYDKQPAALVAMVQIVNSYAELGQWNKARTANERAKVFLKRIPEEAFDDPHLPMSREHWQRWLDWTSQLASTSTTEGGAAP